MRAIVEGVELSICSKCSKYGKVLGPVRTAVKKEVVKRYAPAPVQEKMDLIVENYADLIRKKRESTGMSQRDFAIKLNEKESVLHHIETGKFEPPLEMARKLEKMLSIKLIEEHEEKHEISKSKKTDESFTLGDFIKVRK